MFEALDKGVFVHSRLSQRLTCSVIIKQVRTNRINPLEGEGWGRLRWLTLAEQGLHLTVSWDYMYLPPATFGSRGSVCFTSTCSCYEVHEDLRFTGVRPKELSLCSATFSLSSGPGVLCALVIQC